MALQYYGISLMKREVYCDGKWTKGRFDSFITSLLRSGSRRWGPKFQALANAKTVKRIDPASGRLAQHFRCNCCGGEFPTKFVQVDHIVPMRKGMTWDDFINELFCEIDNLQVLCLDCHKIKTKQERKT